MCSLPLGFFWLLLRYGSFKFRHRLQLKKWRTRTNPQIEHLVVEGAGEYLTQILALRRTAQELRRHRQLDSDDLDLRSTIDETIRGGLFTPIYSSRKSLPEYLVLIDRESFNDQWARLEDEIVQRLIKNDVYIDRYYFQGDPRLCRKDEPKVRYFTLQELAALYPENNLIIFSSGTGLFNPLTGQPQPWLQMFSPWINRALLTPEPYEGSYQRWALSELGFLVLPASKAGMIALGELVSTGSRYGANINNYSKPLPSMLQERSSRWLESYPPSSEILNELCFKLKHFLGDDGYFWLSACAVYPMLYWDLTLYLGYKLTSHERLDERLLSLARLPWFHHGSMPDWLRKQLIFELPRKNELLIRKALEDLLKSSLLHPEGFILTFARGLPRGWEESLQGIKRKVQEWQKRVLLKDFIETEPEDSPAREYVFMSFMSGFKQDRLAVLIPAEVRSILIRKDKSIRELQLLNIFITAVLVGYLVITAYLGTAAILVFIFGVVTTLLFAATIYYVELQALRWEKTAASRYEAASPKQESVSPFDSYRLQTPLKADTTSYAKVDRSVERAWIKRLADVTQLFLIKLGFSHPRTLQQASQGDVTREVKKRKSIQQGGPGENTGFLLNSRYRLIRNLAAGSFGDMYLANDTATQQQVLVKLIKRIDDKEFQEVVASAERGVKLQEQLSIVTPHVLKVHALGRSDEYFYTVMDYVDGKDLATIIQERTLSYGGIIDVATQICKILEVAHSSNGLIDNSNYKGIIHGDIKPTNIRVGVDGKVYLLDFGIARTLSVTQRLTRNDWGSIAYCSPERLETGIVDAQSDLWSVGVLLYEMIAGRRPFEASSNSALEKLIMAGEFSNPLPKDCPERLKKIVTKALAVNINNRYKSAVDLRSELEVLSLDSVGKRNVSRLSERKRTESVYQFADLASYTFKDRLLIRVADLIFYILILIIGSTTRFEIEGWEHWEEASRNGRLPIYTSWHNRIFLATYFWRRRRIVVMTSRSFDGEYISRFIQRFGFGAVRGSSTRGGVGAIVEMVRLMRYGCPVGFTIDGPKGPRYVAKMGAVLLAKKTGHPILPFTITPNKFWELSSWDQFQFPTWFTRALVVIAPPIDVPNDADEESLEAKRKELQQALDEINRRGEDWRKRRSR